MDRVDTSIQKKPKGYKYRIKDYTKSNLGKATVCDHDINRPAYVSRCFGESLDLFYEENKEVSADPNDWGDQHAEYERKLLDIYGPLRGKKYGGKNSGMTDAAERYSNLVAKLG